MNKVELLAPAGSVDAFKAAVENGADAIYIGARNFGARKSVGFSDEEVIELVKYAHIRDVKVYVTLNTLIYDDEMKEVLEVVDFLYNADVDAVLVQDLGLLYLIRKMYPDFEVHASTQLNTHTEEQAAVLKSLGIERVVLSREASLETIRRIKENLNMEVEVFVHGALCMSYSGQCLMSSFIGKRSGNQGECAQPCRLPYSLKSENKTIVENKYLLSMKDLNTLDNLKDILDAGADSLKIEGRLKNPEYVAKVVRTYRDAIDCYYLNQKFEMSNKDKKELAQVFNRDFTKGYMNRENPSNIVNIERSNNKGVLIGRVVNVDKYKFHVKLDSKLNQGDGVRIVGKSEDGFYVNKMYKKNDYVSNGKAGDIVSFDYRKGVCVHDEVYKTFDKELNERLQETYSSFNVKKDIFVNVYAHKNEKLVIKVSDGINEVEYISSYVVDKALKTPTSKEKILEQLSKLNDTPYRIESINFDIEEDVIIPISSINELRRESLLLLNEKRAKKHVRGGRVSLVNKEIKVVKTEDTLKVKVSNKDQEDIAVSCGYKYIYTKEDVKGGNVYQPRINNRIKESYISNQILITELSGLKYHKYLIADAYMNTTNIYAAYVLYSLGCKCVTLSLEMSEKRISKFAKNYEHVFGYKPSLEMIVYGYIDLMVMKYCPINKGLGLNKQGCMMCTKSKYYLEDRKGFDMPIVNEGMCTVKLLNPRRLNLLRYISSLREYGVNNIRVELTIEDQRESKLVCEAYKKAFDGYVVSTSFNDVTMGYYNE